VALQRDDCVAGLSIMVFTSQATEWFGAAWTIEPQHETVKDGERSYAVKN
jgi:hypothetical protein